MLEDSDEGLITSSPRETRTDDLEVIKGEVA
jgi:hypothetical protein